MASQVERRVRGITVGLLMLLWQLGGTRSVAAHGIDRLLQQEGVQLGSYALTIWTSPSRWRPGEVHVDVRVVQGDGKPSTAQLVQVTIVPLELPSSSIQTVSLVQPDSAQTVQRTLAYPLRVDGSARNAATHEAAFHLTQPGDYEVRVTLADGQGAVGEVRFDMQVVPPSPWMIGLLNLLLFVSLTLCIWLWQMGAALWSLTEMPLFGNGKGIQKQKEVQS